MLTTPCSIFLIVAIFNPLISDNLLCVILHSFLAFFTFFPSSFNVIFYTFLQMYELFYYYTTFFTFLFYYFQQAFQLENQFIYGGYYMHIHRGWGGLKGKCKRLTVLMISEFNIVLTVCLLRAWLPVC